LYLLFVAAGVDMAPLDTTTGKYAAPVQVVLKKYLKQQDAHGTVVLPSFKVIVSTRFYDENTQIVVFPR
jgi:hypothetical protein